MKKIFIIVFALCTIFNGVSANYERNIDDDFAIYQLDLRIGKILDKYENREEISKKIQKILLQKLGKTSNDLSVNGRFEMNSFKSLKEYTFYKVYLYLKFGDGLHYLEKDEDLRILENKYIRLIVAAKWLNLDNEGLYIENNGNRKNFIEFLNIKTEESLSDLINRNYLPEEYVGKCYVDIFDKSHRRYGAVDTYYLNATDEYKSKFFSRDLPNCGEYGYGTFVRKTKTLVFYEPYPFEYNGYENFIIEIKK